MYPSLAALVLPLLVTASQVQEPLLDNHAPVNLVIKKPLITSEALQADIDVKQLLSRAKHLFELAKLSIDEYAHPTRVIGSKGELACQRFIAPLSRVMI